MNQIKEELISDFITKLSGHQKIALDFDEMRRKQEEIAKQIKANQAAINKAPDGSTLDQMKAKSQSITDDILTRGKQQQPSNTGATNTPKPEPTMQKEEPKPKPQPQQQQSAPKPNPTQAAPAAKAKLKIGGKGIAGLTAAGLAGLTGAGIAMHNKKKKNEQMKTAQEELIEHLTKVAVDNEEKKKKTPQEKVILAGSAATGAGLLGVSHGKKMGELGAREAKNLAQMLGDDIKEYASALGTTPEHLVEKQRSLARTQGRIGGGVTGGLLGLGAGALINKGIQKHQEKIANEIYEFFRKTATSLTMEEVEAFAPEYNKIIEAQKNAQPFKEKTQEARKKYDEALSYSPVKEIITGSLLGAGLGAGASKWAVGKPKDIALGGIFGALMGGTLGEGIGQHRHKPVLDQAKEDYHNAYDAQDQTYYQNMTRKEERALEQKMGDLVDRAYYEPESDEFYERLDAIANGEYFGKQASQNPLLEPIDIFASDDELWKKMRNKKTKPDIEGFMLNGKDYVRTE